MTDSFEDFNSANVDKKDKYGTDFVRNAAKLWADDNCKDEELKGNPESRKFEAHGIVVNWRGRIHKTSADVLVKKIGLKKNALSLISQTTAARGQAIVNVYNRSTWSARSGV